MTTEIHYSGDDKIQVEYSAKCDDYVGRKEFEIEFHSVQIHGVEFKVETLPGAFVDAIKDEILEDIA